MDIKRIQTLLKSMLLYKGRVDGIVGPKTMRAVAQYQKSHNLEQSGLFSKEFLQSIGLIPISDRLTPKIPYDIESDLQRYYGSVGKNLTRLELPYKMKLAWDTDIQISSFYCHKKVKDDLQSIFKQTLTHYSLEGIKELKLDLFGGCYNKRRIRGGSRWSTHARGISIDLAPQYNQLHWGKKRAIFAKADYDKFWEIVYNNNFYSLGKEKGYDFQHIQRAIPIKR